MIAINKLYGVLLGASAVASAYQWYVKKFTPIPTNDKVKAILAVILKSVPVDKRAVFACLVCTEILKTVFGPEIKKLDPVNTYVPVARKPDAGNDDDSISLFSLTAPADAYKALVQYLDTDIKEQLTAPAWIDYIGAACLQMLREISK